MSPRLFASGGQVEPTDIEDVRQEAPCPGCGADGAGHRIGCPHITPNAMEQLRLPFEEPDGSDPA